jgi:hypothetical protein
VAAEAVVGAVAAVVADGVAAVEMAGALVGLAGEVPVAVGLRGVGRLIMRMLSKTRRTFA